jgi:hypothetical protein
MKAGDIYTVAGHGEGFGGDGGLATSALMRIPSAVSVDAAGNLVISDSGNGRIRVVATATGTFYGQAMTAGDIYTIASGLDNPGQVVVDANGNIVFPAPYDCAVQVLAARTGTFYGQAMTAGDIYTVAGNGTYGYAGDGGPATSAEFRNPDSVAVDASGNVIVSDQDNDRVRVVADRTGMFYGIPMTAGHIYTVAGNGTEGYAGDGGPSTSSELTSPSGVSVTPGGDILISDVYNGRIREVAG